MKKIVVDKYVCARCGQCVLTCPSRLFTRDSVKDYPSVVEGAGEICISCHHCVAVCPGGGIRVDDVGAKDCEPLTKEMVPRFDHIANLIRMRRSIRRYSDKPLDEQVIAQVLNVVRWSPTAKNGLPVKWIVVNGYEKVHELAALIIEWMRPNEALKSLVDAWDAGNDPVLRGAPCLIVVYTDESAMWPVVDCALAVGTLDLCAAAMRLGSCWAGFFTRAAQNDPAINRWLGLTDNQTVQGGLMLGHIDNEVYRRIPHRPELDLRWIK